MLSPSSSLVPERLILFGNVYRLHAEADKCARTSSAISAQVTQVWWKGQLIGVALSGLVSPSSDFPDGVAAPLLSPAKAVSSQGGFLIRPGRHGQESVWSVSPADASLELLEDLCVLGGSPHAQGALENLIQSGAFNAFVDNPVDFEVLAHQDDLADFYQALRETRWDESVVDAWWRCSENWLRRGETLPHELNVFGRSSQDDEQHQAQVLSALARAIPEKYIDVQRAEGLIRKTCSPNHASHRSSLEWASSCWAREVLGADQAWSAWEARVDFVNSGRPQAVEWFRQLSPSQQHHALSEARAQREMILGKGVSPENLGVSDMVPSLVEACPDWEWGPVLMSMRQSCRSGHIVESTVDRMESEKAQSRLESQIPQGHSGRPKTRM